MAAETPTPAKGTPAWFDYAQEQFGWIADLYQSVPEVQKIVDIAVKEKYTPERFNNAIKSTAWWKSTDAKERAYIEKQTSDPTTLANDISAKQIEIETYIGKQGYQVDKIVSMNLATQAVKYAWDVSETARYVGAELLKTGRTAAGEPITEGADATTIAGYASDYGLKLDDATTEAFTKGLINKTLTAEQVKESFRQSAENLYPALKGQLESGRTVAQATAGYRAIAASTLGIDANTIDFTDPNKWGKLLSYQDPNTNEARLMNVSEWGRFLRGMDEWQQTDEAKTLYRDVASTITRGFGKIRG